MDFHNEDHSSRSIIVVRLSFHPQGKSGKSSILSDIKSLAPPLMRKFTFDLIKIVPDM